MYACECDNNLTSHPRMTSDFRYVTAFRR